MNESLPESFDHLNDEQLCEEARRQSLAASKIPWKDAAFWEKLADEALNDEPEYLW